MIIQSKKVWIADQFTPAQLELEDGIIKEIVIGPKAEITDHDIQQLLCVNGFDDIIIRKSDASYQ